MINNIISFSINNKFIIGLFILQKLVLETYDFILLDLNDLLVFWLILSNNLLHLTLFTLK